jgi:hypothetical protein
MATDNRFELRGVQAWPTFFFLRTWSRHEEFQKQIVEFLYGLKSSQPDPIASGVAEGSKASSGIYEGDFDLFQRNHEPLQELVRFIRGTLASAVCIANQEGQPQDLAVEIVDSWYHITNQHGFHDAHWHHGCSWCGIFYVQLGDSSRGPHRTAPNGGSRFYSPFSRGGSYKDFGNKYLADSMDAPIEDGMLLLFPSYLLHSGLPYIGLHDRVVIAFNARVFLRDGTRSPSNS